MPRLKKVLRLLRPMATYWNSMFYLIKRALALRDSLVKFSNLEGSRNGEYPTTNSIYNNVEVLIWSYSHTTTLVHPPYVRILCPHSNPKNTKINLEYWQSYEDLEECMEPLKTLSLLLKSST